MIVFSLLSSLLAAPQAATTIEVRDAVVQADVQNFGINLGSTSPWGSSLMTGNIIDNPGFEPGFFGMVTHAASGTTGTEWIQDFWDVAWNNDNYGIGQPEGFWNGAEYEIVYGPSAGRRGSVLDYRHENGKGVFELDQSGPTPAVWDVMFVRKAVSTLPNLGDWASIEEADARPGSPGTRCLRLKGDPGAAWRPSRTWYFDTLYRDGDLSAGKMQLVRGDWKFSIWAKATAPGDSLRVVFKRDQEATFIDETFPLTTQWQLIERSYSFADGLDPDREYSETEARPILAFQLKVGGTGQEVLVDDVVFERVSENGTQFLDEVVDALAPLKPGVLRYWADNLGDTLENLTAETFAEGFVGFSPRTREANGVNFRFHDFLDLCRQVGADPWYVIPPTFSPEDLEGLIEYLAGPADGAHPYADLRSARGQQEPWTEVFGKIHLEYGNEAWGGGNGGDPFMGGSLMGGTRLGAIAHERFSILRACPFFQAEDFDLIIGGQAGWAGQQTQIEAASSAHDTIALAPYYASAIDDFTTDEDIFHRLYAGPTDDILTGGRIAEAFANVDTFGQGTGHAIYELNFHTTHASAAPPEVRNRMITSHAGGLALPLHMLTYLESFGTRAQCAFTFLKYSHTADDGEKVRIWGLQRDLLSTGRARPGMLSLALTNLGVRGDMIETMQDSNTPQVSVTPANGLARTTDLDLIQSFAFRDGHGRTLILFNLDLQNAHEIILDTSAPITGFGMMGALAPADYNCTNETSEELAMDFRLLPGLHDGSRLTLPPASMVVLGWTQ